MESHVNIKIKKKLIKKLINGLMLALANNNWLILTQNVEQTQLSLGVSILEIQHLKLEKLKPTTRKLKKIYLSNQNGSRI